MKKTIITTALFYSLALTAQENTTPNFKKNELKINTLLTVLGIPEITYERLLDKESGLGISVSVNTIDDDMNKILFMATPYYRFYFGEKPAAGLFLEGFGMINTVQLKSYYYYDPPQYHTEYEKYTNFALGFGIGSKWITGKGILFEINGGVGRNLTNTDKNEELDHIFVGRGGITIGYRF